MMTREEMMDKVIRQYGFENEYTLWFCRLAENPTVSDEILVTAVAVLENLIFAEEE